MGDLQEDFRLLCEMIDEGKLKTVFWVCPTCEGARVLWEHHFKYSIVRCARCGAHEVIPVEHGVVDHDLGR